MIPLEHLLGREHEPGFVSRSLRDYVQSHIRQSLPNVQSVSAKTAHGVVDDLLGHGAVAPGAAAVSE
jgi:hypothetical protein